ncbi:MAG: PQQ-binding-like beta-propeller repeat protein, partial [Acidobacteria bacterium]|nr:PQQ-binding-like beta-propeller repeat protein [Acidobacteriota bacterium]
FVAFQQKDGKVAWKSESLENAPCSPLLITVDGQEQMVTMMSSEIVGIDPNSGKLLWSHPHRTEWGLNISTPVWGDDNILFVSSAYNGGSRAIELRVVKGKTEVKELWATKRMRVHHGTAIRIGDVIYGSSGDFGPAPLTAIEAKTGKILWQDRSLPKASFVYADGKLVIVAEDGDLALATVSPAGLKVLAKSGVLKSNAWTSPTLVGTKLYVRDRKSMVALDLK